MRILGIEGTAWAASAAVYETPDERSEEGVSGQRAGAERHASSETPSGARGLDKANGERQRPVSSETATTASDDDHVFIETDAYQPESGGIHPREAAEHMGEAVPEVVETALAHARERAAAAGEDTGAPVDAVAFSRGPGLGPCLRIVATAARAVAQRLDVPLVGVNHMVAHLEVGRYFSGFDAPVCLNASGANAHVLGYRSGRYRVRLPRSLVSRFSWAVCWSGTPTAVGRRPADTRATVWGSLLRSVRSSPDCTRLGLNSGLGHRGGSGLSLASRWSQRSPFSGSWAHCSHHWAKK